MVSIFEQRTAKSPAFMERSGIKAGAFFCYTIHVWTLNPHTYIGFHHPQTIPGFADAL